MPVQRRFFDDDQVVQTLALVQTGPIADDGSMQLFSPVEALFKGRHFDGQIIILCVSWYTSFKLSLRDLVIMMADRDITLTHTQLFCDGSSITCQNSSSAGADMLVQLVDPGGWTRHI
jgi:hypothetical protein